MQYLGGKSRLGQRIAKVICEHTNKRGVLVEPFCGGCGATIALSPHFEQVCAYDIHEDLILMWRAVKDGWLPPENINESDYKALRHSEPSALRGFVGFGCSWGGKWFGGYARGASSNYARVSCGSIGKQIPFISNVVFDRMSYQDIIIPYGAVVYCDPPYRGTTGYKDKFDHDEFWAVAERWTKERGATVFVSEFSAPPHWGCVWELERKIAIRGNPKESVAMKIDKLFMLRPKNSTANPLDTSKTHDVNCEHSRENKESVMGKATVESVVEKIYELNDRKSKLADQVKAINEVEEKLKAWLIDALQKNHLTKMGVQCSVGKVTIFTKENTKVSIADWDETLPYIRENGRWELLNKAVSSKAVKELLENGEEVPGINVFRETSLSMQKK